MLPDTKEDAFLSQYYKLVYNNALKLREILLANLPGVIEQIDLPAKMITYCYGQKYVEMVLIARNCNNIM